VEQRSAWEFHLLPYSPLLSLGRYFSSLIFYRVSSTPRAGDQPVAMPLPTHRTTQTQNKHTETYVSEVGFELMIPVFERAKRVHALDRAVTVISSHGNFRVDCQNYQPELLYVFLIVFMCATCGVYLFLLDSFSYCDMSTHCWVAQLVSRHRPVSKISAAQTR
jgi:hypothetical protein